MFLDTPKWAAGITLLILYSVVCYTLETFPNNSETLATFLHYSELAVMLLFSVEYLLRVALAKKRLKFIFSFYGLIDLIAILPFFLMFAIDLQALRLLRIFRLMQILKLVRYSRALHRFATALSDSKEELIIFSIASVLLLYFSAVGIYHFEHGAQPEVFGSIMDCLWWSVATLTTVGYGDIYPVTDGGRFFTFAVLMIGLGLVAVPTGIVASALSNIKKGDA